MKECKIEIGNKTYNVKVAQTDQEQSDGLQNVASLPNNEGMLFVFEDNEERSFWMEDTPIPLDIIFIDEDLIVKEVYTGEPNSTRALVGECTYVLEVNPNSGVKIGDELDFEPDNKQVKKTDKM